MSFTEQLKQTTGNDITLDSTRDAYKTFKAGALEAAQRRSNSYKSFLLVDSINSSPNQKKEKVVFYFNGKEDVKRAMQIFLDLASFDGFKIDNAKIVSHYFPQQKRNIFGKVVDAGSLELYCIEVKATW